MLTSHIVLPNNKVVRRYSKAIELVDEYYNMTNKVLFKICGS